MKQVRNFTIAAALIAVAGCQAGEYDSVAERAEAVSNGEADTAFTGVCGMQVQPPPEDDGGVRPTEYCSCVLVGLRAVITSASCVIDLEDEEPIDFSRIDLRFGDTYEEGERVEVDAVEINRAFRIEDSGDANLAMLHLAADPPNAVDELPISDADLDSVLTEGTNVVVVGFGANVEGETAEAGFGTRFRGVTQVSGLDDTGITLRFLEADPVAPCDGDAGGAVLFDDGDDVSLVGVIFGTGACGSSNTSRHPRIDRVAGNFVFPFVDRYDGPCSVGDGCQESCPRSPDPDCSRCLQQGPRLPGDDPVFDSSQDDPPPDCFLTEENGESCPARDGDCGIGSILGEECELTAECETDAGCIAARDDETFSYCSATCDADEDCLESMECTEAGVCEFRLPSPGSQGSPCAADIDCPRENTFCVEAICVTTCETDADCPDNNSRFPDEPYTCAVSPDADGQRVCLGPVISGGGGFCAPTVAGTIPGGRRGALGSICLLMLVAIALVWTRRRQD